MPFGMDVGLSQGDFVLDGEPVPLPDKGAETTPRQKNRPMIIVAKLLDGSICHLVWSLRDIVFDVDPATPRNKGTPTPTQFLAHVCCGQMAG